MIVERKEHQEKDGSVGYIECIYKSDNVLKTTYFPMNHRLYIAFSRGHTYSYANIDPELYVEFENADSHGSFFHKKINNNSKHPSRKEFTLYPNEVQELKEIVEEHNNLDENEQ